SRQHKLAVRSRLRASQNSTTYRLVANVIPLAELLLTSGGQQMSATGETRLLSESPPSISLHRKLLESKTQRSWGS
ncbi:MAG: hypothetical protein ACUVQR_09010, partial [Thermogutta sp.]